MKKVPGGVKAISVFLIVLSIIWIVAAFILFVLGSDIPGNVNVIVIYTICFVSIIMGIGMVYVAYYLWKAKNWARIVIITFSFLGVMGGFLNLALGYIPALCGIILYLVIALYLLLNSNVRKAFSKKGKYDFIEEYEDYDEWEDSADKRRWAQWAGTRQSEEYLQEKRREKDSQKGLEISPGRKMVGARHRISINREREIIPKRERSTHKRDQNSWQIERDRDERRMLKEGRFRGRTHSRPSFQNHRRRSRGEGEKMRGRDSRSLFKKRGVPRRDKYHENPRRYSYQEDYDDGDYDMGDENKYYDDVDWG